MVEKLQKHTKVTIFKINIQNIHVGQKKACFSVVKKLFIVILISILKQDLTTRSCAFISVLNMHFINIMNAKQKLSTGFAA